MEQEKRVKLRIKEAKKKTEEEKKAAKVADFEKLKQDILAQSHREPIRSCPAFNFVEPTPVLTAEARKHLVENKIIKADVDLSRERDKKELLEFIHESTYSITE